MEQDLTTGSVFKRIVYFSLPYLLSYFLQTLYGMADLFITGQFYGVDTITAVSNGSQIMHMMTVIIVGLAMGTTVTIGHSVGAKCMEQAEKIIGNTITLFMGIAVAFTVILVVLVKPIVVLIAAPQEAVAGTSIYLLICFIGIPFITAYNIISSIFRGLGDSNVNRQRLRFQKPDVFYWNCLCDEYCIGLPVYGCISYGCGRRSTWNGLRADV